MWPRILGLLLLILRGYAVGTLCDRIHNEDLPPLTIPETLSIAHDLAEAMAVLHPNCGAAMFACTLKFRVCTSRDSSESASLATPLVEFRPTPMFFFLQFTAI